MDIISTFLSLASRIPGAAEYVIQGVSDYIPDELSQVIKHAYTYFPTEIRLEDAAQFILYFAAASLVLGVISRVVLGQRSSLNHSLSSAIGIGCIYILTAIIYTFRPWDLEQFLSPLPFVTFSGEYMILLPITDVQFNTLCQQVLSLVILSFLVNLLDSIVPRGEGVLSWYVLRILTVILSMVLHLIVSWAVHTYLSDLLVDYAPTALLIVLAILLFSGIVSLVVGLVIAVTNPFLGAMYSFFFSSIIGKQVSKAVFSSAVLCLAFWLIENFGYTVISISAAALTAYIPLILVLLVLWYIIGHLL